MGSIETENIPLTTNIPNHYSLLCSKVSVVSNHQERINGSLSKSINSNFRNISTYAPPVSSTSPFITYIHAVPTTSWTWGESNPRPLNPQQFSIQPFPCDGHLPPPPSYEGLLTAHYSNLVNRVLATPSARLRRERDPNQLR